MCLYGEDHIVQMAGCITWYVHPAQDMRSESRGGGNITILSWDLSFDTVRACVNMVQVHEVAAGVSHTWEGKVSKSS